MVNEQRRRGILLTLALLLAAGCSDEKAPASTGDTGPIGDPDRGAAQPDTGDGPPACQCAMDKICDTTGACITPPTPAQDEASAEVSLLRQFSLLDIPVNLALQNFRTAGIPCPSNRGRPDRLVSHAFILAFLVSGNQGGKMQ